MAADRTLNVLGESLVRAILVDCNTGLRSAEELADRHGVSRSTVYRKLDALQSVGLIEESNSAVSPGESRRYRTAAQRLTVDITVSGIEVDVVARERDLSVE